MRFSPLLLPLLPLLEPSHGFQPLPANRASTNSRSSRSAPPLALSYNLRDADMMESLVGGIRYEMVPLPDSMMDTTLFVGNLCEFCKDEDLSNLFQTVSTLQSVPACVVRKPNMSSLRYGFVTFLTAQEKEVRRLQSLASLRSTISDDLIRFDSIRFDSIYAFLAVVVSKSLIFSLFVLFF